jgi:hypothetical protein
MIKDQAAVPSNFAIIQACIVGLVIPVLSAIAPIQ